MPSLPTVWFTKNLNPTLHRVRETAQSGRYHVLASHISPDASYLGAAHQGFLEPADIIAEDYLAWVLDRVQSRRVQALVGGRHVRTLAAHRAEFSELGCHLILPSLEAQTFELCGDKTLFYEVFSPRIPMPATRTVENWDDLLAAALELEAQHGSACFKPARGIYGLGFRILSREPQLKAFLAGDQLHLTYQAAELLFRDQGWPPMLVMETLPGVEYSIDALARKGELLTCVQRCKVGGLGNVQTAVDRAELGGFVALLASELQMDGLFNVQFKEDALGVPRLLEVNARASGGLAISAGLSGLKLGLLEVDAHFDVALGDLSFAAGQRVTDAREVIVLPPPAVEQSL